MDKERQNVWSSQRKIILVILLCSVFSITGCGSSNNKEDAVRKAAERQELMRKKGKILSDQISKKHNAISFPPEGIGADAFTYELQTFLSAEAEKVLLFKGYLEDIEKTERGVVVEFLCPLGEHFFLDKTAIRFRLTALEEKVKPLLEVKRTDFPFYSIRYLGEPDYLVVAKITEVKRSRRYEFRCSARGDEVEIDVEVPPSFVSAGELVEAIPIFSAELAEETTTTPPPGEKTTTPPPTGKKELRRLPGETPEEYLKRRRGVQ